MAGRTAAGLALFLDSRAAAVAWAEQGLKRGVRFMDIGCLQVNWQLHPGAFASLDRAFDPTANADYAARYLRTLYKEARGNWNVAVGWYHSHTVDLAAEYRYRVAAVGAGILTAIGGPEPLYEKARRQGTLRLALVGGGTLALNVHRQPRGRRPRGSSTLAGDSSLARCQGSKHTPPSAAANQPPRNPSMTGIPP